MINNTRLTYFAPYDDVEHPLVAQINSAKSKIRLADYSFNDPAVVSALIAAKERGVDVSLVLDKSQAAGKTEVPQVQRLVEAQVPHVIGTSDEHKIVHVKYVVIDDLVTISGSYNFTVAAESEDNFMDIEWGADRAAAFTANWEKCYNWIVSNESQTQKEPNVQTLKTNP